MSAQPKFGRQPPPPPPPRSKTPPPLRIALGDGELTTLKHERRPAEVPASSTGGPPPPPAPGALRRSKLPAQRVEMPRPRLGNTAVRSMPVGNKPRPSIGEESHWESATKLRVPAAPKAAVSSISGPLRIAPEPAPITAPPPLPEFRVARRGPADFVSSKPLPTLPNIEGLSRKTRRPSRRRRMMGLAAATALLVAVGALLASTVLPDDNHRTPIAAVAPETEPEPEATADEPEAAAEPETAEEPETTEAPEAAVDPEATAEPDQEPEPTPEAEAAEDLDPETEPDSAAEPEAAAPAPDPQLDKARSALEDGRGLAAWRLAKQSFEAKPNRAALAVMVEAGCALGDDGRARDAYTKLPLSSRKDARARCLELGVEVGA